MLINVSVLDGISEKDIAWNIAVDETNAKVMGGGSVLQSSTECGVFGR